MCVAPPPKRPLVGLASSSGSTQGLESRRIRWLRWHTRVVYGETATLDGQVVTDPPPLKKPLRPGDLTTRTWAR